jgi:hypothetical protein
MRLLIWSLLLLTCGWTGCSIDAQGRRVVGFPGFGAASPSSSCPPDLEPRGVLCRYPIHGAMPPLIDHAILRLAVFPLSENGVPEQIKSTAGEAAIELKKSLPRLQVVERSNIDLALRELQFQASGKVRDDNFVGVGRMLGADHLFIYQVTVDHDGDIEALRRRGGLIRATSSGKLIHVQTGAVVFQQMVEMSAILPPPRPGLWWMDTEGLKLGTMVEALITLFAHLETALLPAPIGAMWFTDVGSNRVKAHCVMHGGPAHDAGIQRGDLIIAIDGIPVRGVGDRVLLDLQLIPRDLVSMTVERNGQEQTLIVRPLKRQS